MQVGKNIFARKYKRDIGENISLFREVGKFMENHWILIHVLILKIIFLNEKGEGNMNLFRNYKIE